MPIFFIYASAVTPSTMGIPGRGRSVKKQTNEKKKKCGFPQPRRLVTPLYRRGVAGHEIIKLPVLRQQKKEVRNIWFFTCVI